MEKNIDIQNKILTDLIKLKTELVDLHIAANNSIDETELLRRLATLTKTSEEVKEMFIIMHSNNITVTKHMNELLVKNMMSVIDVEIDSLRNVLAVTTHMYHRYENNLLVKAKNALIKSKFWLLGGVLGLGVVFLGAELIRPGSSKVIIDFIIASLKIIF